MHNVLPPSSFAAMPSAVSAVPHPATRDDIVEGYGIQLDPTQATSYEQAPEATRRSSGSSVPSTMHGSPLDNLSSSAPSGSLSPRTHHSLTVRRVRHSKRPIMARSVFDPSLPSPPKRIMSLWSSSSLSAKPSSAQIVSRQAVAGPGPSSSAAAGTEVASSEPSGPTTMADIRRLITPDNLKLGKPVGLFKLLRNRTIKDVQHPPLFTPDAAQLHEILVQLKNHAPPIYLLRMASDDKYALVLKKWLIRFGKDPKEWGKCIAPLLQVLSRTEMSYDTLTDFKFGRLAINMIDKAKEAGVDGIKDMETAWKHFKKAAIAIADEDKKRKADEESEGNKVVDSNSAKKQRSEDGTARPVKSETSHGSADMSFFGNTSTLAGPSRPRPKLPDIKKRDPSETAPSKLPASTGPPTPKPPMAPAASLLASTLNAFRQQGAVRPSSNQAVLSANAAISIDSPPAEVKPAGPKPNKKGHVVRFRDNVPDSGDLVMVKEFKEEAWELEKAPWQQDEDLGGKTAHQLDMAEGRALRTHETIEAEIDWYEPLLYEGGAEIPAPTPEVEEQEARERGILGVLYTAAEVPSDPDESGVRIVQRGLQTGTWYPIHHDTSAVPPAAQNAAILSGLQTSASVSELLGSLNRDLFVPPTQQPQVYSYGQSQPAPGANYNYYSQQSQPAASAQPYGGGGSAYQQWTYAGSSAAGTGGYAGYGYEQANDRDRDRRDWDRESGRYGRGGGGGGSGGGGRRHGTVVCKHWLKNACFKGENCTFRHSRD
ncbi:hypothetical protein BD324DRAFT_218235 [Kockovaella imperatae]|uniref:C3H1-type domain-containing protein n=1 Tax=Kockovaella imperatae TaxID=4999 RepID=A0A1Y1U6D3_9TREE|nr:hypothetical protein BD324DRAFT_218235 [Kockovaella imperatae]ORX33600.1 hypothetical protein BD324DRAFT_218235 [Kockovaella imperatae]